MRRKAASARLDQQRTLGRHLCRWFAREARDLPWRRNRNGYTSLVAEFMLQQTQVSRVVDYYCRFIRRFPTVRALARADEQEVLSLWQGLGYYRRARMLHAAAKMIVLRFRGRVPERAEQLRELPGVGRYTAGAIASISFGHAEPIVDGNVQRVLARLRNDSSPTESRSMVERTWSHATELVSAAGNPAAFNEALMELGATICTPKSPQCRSCPIAAFCAARAAGRESSIPRAKARAAQRTVHHHAVVIHRSGRLLMEQRPSTGLWAGLWQVPTIETANRKPPGDLARILQLGLLKLQIRSRFEFCTTHRRILFHVYSGAPTTGSAADTEAEAGAARTRWPSCR
jgi:A/G-specific adenine glycosylase